MNRSRNWLLAAVVVSALALLSIALPSLPSRVAYALQSAQADTAGDRLQSVQDLSEAFANVADIIRPSVVSISSARRVEASQRGRRMPHPFFDSPFRDFFGDDFFDRFFRQPSPRDDIQRDYIQRGLGTGVIVSDDGHILTNNHVVGGAEEVIVKLSDDRTFTAKLLGTDPKTDLAMLKIDAKGLHPAKLGDSDELKVGEWVVAAGNPFGLSSSITAGIVSAKGRARFGIADYEDFIQTDAAINPGNSGGPLVNLRGEVVGINTAIFTRSGGYMGIGFAIPISMAKSIMKSLIDEGRVVRGWLGVLIQDLNEGLAKSFGYDSTDGVLVGDVTPDGPAQKAGLEAGDIIVSYDKRKVASSNELRLVVADTKPGTVVEIEIFRNGKSRTLEVEIGDLEAGAVAAGAPARPEDLGMSIRTVTPNIARQLGEDPNLRGVVVTEVEPLSPAERAGIQVKDVIVTVQGEAVDGVSEFRSALGKYDLKEGVRLGVRRESMKLFMFIRNGD